MASKMASRPAKLTGLRDPPLPLRLRRVRRQLGYPSKVWPLQRRRFRHRRCCLRRAPLTVPMQARRPLLPRRMGLRTSASPHQGAGRWVHLTHRRLRRTEWRVAETRRYRRMDRACCWRRPPRQRRLSGARACLPHLPPLCMRQRLARRICCQPPRAFQRRAVVARRRLTITVRMHPMWPLRRSMMQRLVTYRRRAKLKRRLHGRAIHPRPNHCNRHLPHQPLTPWQLRLRRCLRLPLQPRHQARVAHQLRARMYCSRRPNGRLRLPQVPTPMRVAEFRRAHQGQCSRRLQWCPTTAGW